jgi:uncharacterized 2Fe-2S/4Fe-4S cluster protein (DUF4445 family)
MPRVIFEPLGSAIEVAPGTSVLEAARRAGVSIRNDCGGTGACGRCIVRLMQGHVHRLESRHKLPRGEDLACRVLVLEDDVVVFVPRTSLEVAGEVTVRRSAPARRDFPPSSALVRRRRVSLPQPTLEDNVCDEDRLLRALKDGDGTEYRMTFSALKSLPGQLRKTKWRPTVTVTAAAAGAEVLDIGPSAEVSPAILAVDVGTTALKVELLSHRGRWWASSYNSQVMYGPDVISRIVYCQQHDGGLERLHRLVAGDINRLLLHLLREAGLNREDVVGVVASGNTTMMHLLLGIEPYWIRREPYVGCTYHTTPVKASEAGISIHPEGRLFCLPSVGAYVGADITAGVLATGLSESDATTMLIDLGTNGEIVIGNRQFMVCCSASAGPAFEGEASTSGTRARPGAIDSVVWENGLRWKTIEDKPPVGICGSGYIDLLAVLLRQGIIDRTGRLQEGASDRVRESEDGELHYVLVEAEDAAGGEAIVLSQSDIGNLVRAKGAIYAAACVLLESLGMGWKDMEVIRLAGGFGDTIDKENAVAIGLLPDVPRDRIEFVGNTSLQGAVMAALDEGDYVKVRDIARRMTYFELSTHQHYMPQFVAACFLPHTQAEEFPSVTGAGVQESVVDRRKG